MARTESINVCDSRYYVYYHFFVLDTLLIRREIRYMLFKFANWGIK